LEPPNPIMDHNYVV